MRIINDNVVQGCLSENYLTRKFITRNICDAKYSRITVVQTRVSMNVHVQTASAHVTMHGVCALQS